MRRFSTVPPTQMRDATAITLRPITPEDTSFLLAVYASNRALELVHVPWGETQKQAFLASQFQAQHQHYQAEFPEATYAMILYDEEPVGRLYVDRRPDEVRILDLAVLPAYQEHGILRTVLGDLLDEATDARTSVGMYVELYKQPFLNLLQDLGFVQEEDHGVSLFMRWQAPA